MDSLQTDSEFLNSLRFELKEIIDKFQNYLSQLSSNQLNWRIAGSTWSVYQQLMHIKLHNDTYLQLSFKETRKALDQGLRNPGQPFRSCPMGSLYTGIISPTSLFKFVSIDSFVPPDLPRANNLQGELIPATQKIMDLIDDVDKNRIDLNKVRFRVPGSQTYEFRIGDVLKIMLVHSQRHLLQIQEILNHPDFPEY